MRFSKLYSFILTFALTLLIAGCGSKSDVVELKIAHGLDITHPVHKAMEFMAEKAFEKSAGKMKIDIYPNEQLGNEKECIEQLQLGSLAMTKVSSSPLESFVPAIKVFALPFLFRDADHKWKVFNGPIGKQLLAAPEKKGLKGLVYYDAGARSFYSTNKPILSPDDLKGMKIRTQQSPVAIKMIGAFGGSATPIAWGELYTSLQQGVVDGAENNAPSLFTSNHYEVCKYYSLDEHTMVPDMLLISTIVWNKLDPAMQKILQEAADESEPYERELWSAFVKECMDKMVAAGVKVYNPDKAPFMEKAKVLWQEFEGTEIGELAKQIQEVQ